MLPLSYIYRIQSDFEFEQKIKILLDCEKSILFFIILYITCLTKIFLTHPRSPDVLVMPPVTFKLPMSACAVGLICSETDATSLPSLMTTSDVTNLILSELSLMSRPMMVPLTAVSVRPHLTVRSWVRLGRMLEGVLSSFSSEP